MVPYPSFGVYQPGVGSAKVEAMNLHVIAALMGLSLTAVITTAQTKPDSPPATQAQVKQEKADAKARAKQEKQRAKDAQAAKDGEEARVRTIYCNAINRIPMGELTTEQQGHIKLCRYMGLL